MKLAAPQTGDTWTLEGHAGTWSPKDIMMELNGGFLSRQCLGVTELDVEVFMEGGEETALFLLLGTHALICHNNAVFYSRPFYKPSHFLRN